MSQQSQSSQQQSQQHESPDKDEAVEARHRKQLKALDGERRAAVKKLKSTKGKKKAKEAVAATESEYDVKLAALKARHERELHELAAALQQQANIHNGDGEAAANDDEGGGESPASPKGVAAVADSTTEEQQQQQPTGEATSTINKKQEKARRKRERQRQAALDRERQIAAETANAGPSPRDVELQRLQSHIVPPAHRIAEIPADGHCLYRAVAAQLNRRHLQNQNGNDNDTAFWDYQSVRALCAGALLRHADEYRPFCELLDDNGDEKETFQDYCDRVRSSSDWGGHLEIRALATALRRCIEVYSVAHGCVAVEPDDDDDDDPESTTTNTATNRNNNNNNDDEPPIRLSYHVHYYALGEHYNEVVIDE